MNTLENVVARHPATAVADVLQMLTDINQLLPDTDGLKFFNHLYLAVTTTVRDAIATGTFNDAPWLSQLDVVFANLYFDALGMGAVDVSAGPFALPKAKVD